MSHPSLFESNPEKIAPVSAIARSVSKSAGFNWLFLTNQLNLMMILASGLLMSREGFGDKYYQDLLTSYPGWIPLFPNSIPRTLVDRVVAEARHLSPVAVEVDIAAIEGPAKMVLPFGALQDIILPTGLSDTASMLLVKAPLPLQMVKKIYFASVDDKKSFVSRAQSQYGNVPEAWFDKATDKKRFTGKSICPVNAVDDWRSEIGSIARAQAMGSMFTLFFHLANRSDLGSRFFQWLTGTLDDCPGIDPLLKFLPAWFIPKVESSQDSIQVSIFWTLVNDIVSAQAIDLSRDVALAALRREIDHLENSDKDRYHAKLNQLCLDLEALRGLSDDTLDDLFKRHTRPFSRALILFFLMNHCRELLEFEHKALDASDLLAAAILFGAREGWIDLAVDLRHSQRFADGMVIRMADYCHITNASGVVFAAPTPSILPLRALLEKIGDGRQQKGAEEAMIAIARAQNWNCIETTIRLPKGEYRFLVEPGSTRLVLEGDIRSVHSRVKREAFWNLLSRLPLPLPEPLEALARKIAE